MNRNTPPRLRNLSTPSLLTHQTERLANGLEIVYLHDPNQEVFKMDVVLPAGTYYQPRPVVASTMLNLLNEGTPHHTSEEIAEVFDFHGAYVEYNCGLHTSEISLISLNKYASHTIPLVAEMIQESHFPQKELDLYLRNRKQRHLVDLEKTSYLARGEFLRLLYGQEHPYANHFETSDFDQVHQELVRQFHRERLHAPGCRIVVSGHVDDNILQEIRTRFVSLEASSLPTTPAFIPSPHTPKRYFIEKNNAVQSSIRIGKQGVHLTNEAYPDFQLLNTILGGYFGSRLMANIREEKGYTYNIQSFNVSMRDAAHWCIATDVNASQTEAALTEIYHEIHRLQEELVPEEELNLVKNYFHGELLRELDGVFSQADALKHKLNYGIDNTFYSDIIHRVETCTPERLQDLAREHLQTEQLYTVVVGKV